MEIRLPGLGLAGLILALLVASLPACATRDLPANSAAPTPLPEGRRVSEVRVAFSDGLRASDREILDRVGVPLLLRLSALDWFEHEGRFDREGQVELEVEVLELALRSGISVWLWPALVGVDSLAVRVLVRDQGRIRERFDFREHTRVSGFEWRDADARLDRLARRLGRRIAELL